jgi:hypothetical protein
VRNTGHVAELSEQARPCVMAMQSEFFRSGRVTDTTCLAKIPPIPVQASRALAGTTRTTAGVRTSG